MVSVDISHGLAKFGCKIIASLLTVYFALYRSLSVHSLNRSHFTRIPTYAFYFFFGGGGRGDRDTTVGTGSHDWTNDWMDGWINEILPRPTKVRRRRWPTVAGRNRVAAADGPWGQLAPPWPELAPPDWLSVEQLTHAQPQKEPVGNTPLQSNTLARARTLTHADIRTHSRTHTPFGSVRCAQLRDSPMKKQNNTIT